MVGCLSYSSPPQLLINYRWAPFAMPLRLTRSSYIRGIGCRCRIALHCQDAQLVRACHCVCGVGVRTLLCALPTRSASCTAITLALLATRCAPLARYPLVRQGLIVPRESSCCPSITWESQCLSAPIHVATRCFVPGIFVSDLLKMFPLASPLHQPHSTPTLSHTPTDLHPGMHPHSQHDRTHCIQRHILIWISTPVTLACAHVYSFNTFHHGSSRVHDHHQHCIPPCQHFDDCLRPTHCMRS